MSKKARKAAAKLQLPSSSLQLIQENDLDEEQDEESGFGFKEESKTPADWGAYPQLDQHQDTKSCPVPDVSAQSATSTHSSRDRENFVPRQPNARIPGLPPFTNKYNGIELKSKNNLHDRFRDKSMDLLDKWKSMGDAMHGVRVYTDVPVRNLKKYRLPRKLIVPQSDEDALDVMRKVVIHEGAAATPKLSKYNSAKQEVGDNELNLEDGADGGDDASVTAGRDDDAGSVSNYSFSVAGGSEFPGVGISPGRNGMQRLSSRLSPKSIRRSTSVVMDNDAMSRLDDMSEMSSVYDPPQIIKHPLTKHLNEDGGVILNRNLPIYESRELICTAVQQYPVALISGPTGIGKTLQVPLFLLADHLLRTPDAPIRIIVTQPRRIAALSAARRVCYEQSVGRKDDVSEHNSWVLGGLVGYHIGHMRKWSPDTVIIYCTTAVLLQRLLSRGNLDDFTIIILDEAHERDADMDMLLMLVRTLLCKRTDCTTKVLVMSATMDIKHIRQYMEPVAMAHKMLTVHGANSLTIKATMHLTKVFYLEDITTACGHIEFDKTEPKLYAEIMRSAAELVVKIDVEENKAMKSYKIAEKSSVLVFLPGIESLREFADLLNIVLSEKMVETEAARGSMGSGRPLQYSKFECVILHSTSPMEEQERIWQKPPSGKRRIIISTNVAESSITVPDVEFVIDFCLTKRLAMDHHGSIARLSLCWASQSNADQRKGRTGRVQKGQCFRMVARSFFTTLNKHAVSEFVEAPLSSSILKLKSLNSPTHPSVFASLLIEPPMQHDIYHGITVLKELSALSISDNGASANIYLDDGMPTDVGRLMQRLPIDPRLSRLIVLGYCFGFLDEAVVIAAALTVQYVIAQPSQHEWNAYCANLQFAGGSFSDPISLMNMYNEYVSLNGKSSSSNANSTAVQDKKRDAFRWSFVNDRRLNEMHVLVEEIRQRLRLDTERSQRYMQNMKKQMGVMNMTADDRMLLLKTMLAGAFFPFYAISDDQRDEAECFGLSLGTDPRSTVLASVEYDENCAGSANVVKIPIVSTMAQRHRSYAQQPARSTAVLADPPSRVHARAYTANLVNMLHDEKAIGPYAAQIFADSDAVLTHARRVEEPSYFQFRTPLAVSTTTTSDDSKPDKVAENEMNVALPVLVALRIQRSRVVSTRNSTMQSCLAVDGYTRHKDYEQRKIERRLERSRRYDAAKAAGVVQASSSSRVAAVSDDDDDDDESFGSLTKPRAKPVAQPVPTSSGSACGSEDGSSDDSDADENRVEFYHRYQREQLERNLWHTRSTQIGIFRGETSSPTNPDDAEVRDISHSSLRRAVLMTPGRYTLPPVVQQKTHRISVVFSATDDLCSNRFWCRLSSSSTELKEIEAACDIVVKQQRKQADALKQVRDNLKSQGKAKHSTMPESIIAVGECRIVPLRSRGNFSNNSQYFNFDDDAEDNEATSSVAPAGRSIYARAVVVALERNNVVDNAAVGAGDAPACNVVMHFVDYGYYETWSIEELLESSPLALPSNVSDLLCNGASSSVGFSREREASKLTLSAHLNRLQQPALAFPCQLKNVYVAQIHRKQVHQLYEDYNLIGRKCELAVYAHQAETAIGMLFVLAPKLDAEGCADESVRVEYSLSWSDVLLNNKVAIELPDKSSKEAARSRILINIQNSKHTYDADEDWGDNDVDNKQTAEPPKTIGELQSAVSHVVTQREHSRYMLPYAARVPDSKKRRLNVHLYSPMEITKWQSVWSGVELSRVEMARNSTTAICVDAEPDVPFDRVVVAADSRKIGHNTVQLCGTTLMPRQPGMLGLLCMLFGPSVLLRYDEDEQCLIGCRAGMGGDEDGYPLYAEHDAEIMFDCHFTRKDLDDINVARIHINRIVRRAFLLGQLNLHADVQLERKSLLEAVLGLMRAPRRMLYNYDSWRRMKKKQAERAAIGGHYPWKNTVSGRPYQHDAAAVCENHMYQRIDLSCFGVDGKKKAEQTNENHHNNGGGTSHKHNPSGNVNDEDDDGLGAWSETRNQLMDQLAYGTSKPIILK